MPDDAGLPPVCTHHWLIETPTGPVSRGRCKLCGEERDFSNSIETRGHELPPLSEPDFWRRGFVYER